MECPRCQRTLDAKTRRCAWCGVNVPPGQHLLEQSGIVVPIRSGGPDSSGAPRTRLATLGDRLIAMLLDSIVVLVACAMIDAWAFMQWGIVSGTELRVTGAVVFVGTSLNLLFAFLYVWLLEASCGCTLGKAMVGIGVVNNSKRSALAASAIRNLLRMIDGIGFYLVGTLVASCSKFRRRLGDLCGGTYVVEGSLSELYRSFAVLGWLAVLGAGAWALPHICDQPRPTHAPAHLGRVVVEMGRAENSIYFRVPNHGVDVSLVNGSPADANRRAADEEIGKAPKLEAADTAASIR